MNTYEAEAVLHVIEQLVAEVGPHNLRYNDDDIDVTSAIEILNQEMINDGSEEEGTETAVEADLEDVL